MTALGKLFRATAFRLALAILLLSALGAGIVLTVIAWQVVSVVDREIAQTVDVEAKGLIDTFNTAGVGTLGAIIEARKREPGASLYLLTNPIGEPLAGNVQQIPDRSAVAPGFCADRLPRQYERRSQPAGVGRSLCAAGRLPPPDRA